MTGSQLWGNLAGGTASAKALRHSKPGMLRVQKEGGTSVSEWVVADKAGETSKVSWYSQTPQQTKVIIFNLIP